MYENQNDYELYDSWEYLAVCVELNISGAKKVSRCLRKQVEKEMHRRDLKVPFKGIDK